MSDAEAAGNPARRTLRLTLGGMMLLVLVIGVALGWVVRGAKVQRDAVAAIRLAGGTVIYEEPSGWKGARGVRWLRSRLGTDLFDRVVAAHRKGGDDRLMTQVGRLPHLDLLTLSHTEITDRGFSSVADLPGLTSVSLDRNPNLTGACLTHLRHHPAIRWLSYVGDGLRDEHLALLAPMTSLEELQLHSPDYGDAGLIHLRGLSKLKSLRVDVSRVTDRGLAELRPLTGLKRLILPSTVRSLVPLRHLPSLRHLEIYLSSMDDAGLDGIESFPSLETLNMTRCLATDAGLLRIANCPSLRSANIDSPHVTRRGRAAMRAKLVNARPGR